jgi:hypothetical protein
MNPQLILRARYAATNLVVYNAFMELCRQFEPEPQKGVTQEHHICPQKQFPEHKHAPENLITLLAPLHQHAHRLLSAAVPEIQNLAPWIAAGHSPEANRKRSEAQRGKKRGPMSEETRRKMSEANRGKKFGPHSEEHRRKIVDALCGRKHTEEHRRKVSEALRGRTFSEETRRKISEALRSKKTVRHSLG